MACSGTSVISFPSSSRAFVITSTERMKVSESYIKSR
jgi:hypothetical protein